MSFADKVTILRILLIPIFVSFLFYFDEKHLYLRYVLLGVFGLAVLTDYFDGLVARIKKEKSEIGQVIDPLADKLLLLTAFIALYALRKSLPLSSNIPLWVVLIIVSRDLIILLGVMILYFLKIEVPIAPSMWGKLTTFFQMLTVLWVIMDVPFSVGILGYKNIPFSAVIWTVAVIFTLISGAGYFTRGIKSINAKLNSSHK
ncbi:MAG: CDP-alcohol phosphatidyltransferase family protein [Candidatus Omnitrophota bacterium]|nr:CDP-alcohol phosphatidyltransferase family protein [Candidatus Omnitrophota bacterium]